MTNQHAGHLIKSGITILLVSLLILNVELSVAVNTAKRLSIETLLIIILSIFIQGVIGALRWQHILSALNINIYKRKIIQLFFIGLFFNQVLPTSIGGDAIRGWYLYRLDNSKSLSAIAVLMDRIYGMIALVILCISTLPFLGQLIKSDIAYLSVLVLIAAACLAISISYILDKIPINVNPWGMAPGIKLLSKKMRNIIKRPQALVRVILLSVVIHLISILSIFMLLKDVDAVITLRDTFIILPTIILLAMMPISIAGWGLRESVMVVGLSYASVSAEDALVVSVSFGLVLLIIGILGGVVWVFFRRSLDDRVLYNINT